MSRTENMDRLLDELALVIDGDRDALARHADFLADDDEARDLKHDAIEVAERLEKAGADYAPPADLEARLMAALDSRGNASETGRSTSPGFVLDPQAQAEIQRNLAAQAATHAQAQTPAPTAEALGVATTVAMPEVALKETVEPRSGVVSVPASTVTGPSEVRPPEAAPRPRPSRRPASPAAWAR